MHGTPVAGGSERVQVFVQLDEPAVAELNAAPRLWLVSALRGEMPAILQA